MDNVILPRDDAQPQTVLIEFARFLSFIRDHEGCTKGYGVEVEETADGVKLIAYCLRGAPKFVAHLSHAEWAN